jgi:hypothetical protein
MKTLSIFSKVLFFAMILLLATSTFAQTPDAVDKGGDPGNYYCPFTINSCPGNNKIPYFSFGIKNGTNTWILKASSITFDTITGNSIFQGNVGIGTSDPQSPLAVNGKITAKEIEVTLSGWSDYVFARDYKLMPLTEVESYIVNYKHLPDIPSEKEIGDKGLDLGKMDSVLVKKIEELTLYMIELKKENASLNAKIEKLMH